MISVLTATHNHAAYLPEAVQSVRRQAYQDWEHIIVDDGSSDDTPRVLAGLGVEGAKGRVLRTANLGQPAALNLGLGLARGEWVAFLDADDAFLPDHLSHLRETIGELDLTLARFTLINCSGDPRPVVPDFYRPGQEIEVAQIESCTGLLFGRTETFRRLGGFRAVPSSDTDLFNRAKAAGCTWNRAERATYLYYFGRVSDHLAFRELQAFRSSRSCGR